MDYVFPEEGYHHTVLGTTGSGKSTLAAFELSRSPFHIKPAFIIDFKYEEIFARVPRIREIGLHEKLPEHPGVYIVRPRPDEAFMGDGEFHDVENWLKKLWVKGNSWLYIDEGYLMPDKRWLRNVYAQGRSKGITILATSQRPVDVARSFFSEAAYLSVFRLNDRKDVQRVGEFTPPGMFENRLPDFHSFWYSAKHHKTDDPKPYAVLSPVPGADTIIQMFDDRLRPRHTVI